MNEGKAAELARLRKQVAMLTAALGWVLRYPQLVKYIGTDIYDAALAVHYEVMVTNGEEFQATVAQVKK